jgi:hypothetical protein
VFLKLKHVTGPMVINTAHIIAMSPSTEDPDGDGVTGTDIDLVDNKNITVQNSFEDVWSAMKNPGRPYESRTNGIGIREIEGANGTN